MPSFGNSGTQNNTLGSSANVAYGIFATSGSDAGGAAVTGVRIRCQTGPFFSENLKVILTDASGNIITNGISNALTVPAATSVGYQTLVFASAPIIAASTSYGIFAIANGVQLTYYYTSASGGQDSSNSYASPTSPTDYSGNSVQMQLIVDYTVASGAFRRNLLITQAVKRSAYF